MKVNGISGYSDIDDFVKNKIERFSEKGKNFSAFFELMFSEHDNIMYEHSSGYRIIKKTYGEVYSEILKLADGLRNSLENVPSASVVGIYMENSLDWIELFWATVVCGYNPILLNLRLDDETVNTVLKENNVSVVISSGKKFDVATLNFSDIHPGKEEYKSTQFGTEVLVMSSGTTQNIKVCAYTAEEFYYQICGSLEIISTCPQMKCHYNGDLKLLTFLPFYHVFGLIAVYIWFAFFSRCFVQLNDMAPQTVLNTIKRHKVTHIFAVPLFWDTVYNSTIKTVKSKGDKVYEKYLKGMKLAEKLHDVPIIGKIFSKSAFREIREGLFGDSIQFMISGGSNISMETLAFFNNIGYRLANGYGMTEIGITSVELSDKKKYLYGGYVGKPIKYSEYKIDSNGCLHVRGKATAKYIIEGGEKKDNNGWYSTGDIVECLNGHYYIVTREDDVIISSTGENINPFLIESKFIMPGVREACLIKSNKSGEIKPVLILRLEGHIDRESFAAITSSVIETAGRILFPKDGTIVYTTDALMKAEEFKLNRRRIGLDFDSGLIKLIDTVKLAMESDCDDDSLMEELRSVVAMVINREEESIGADDDLFINLGITSLEYFAVISEINSRYEVSVMQTDENSCRTLRQIYTRVKEKNTCVVQNS